MNRDCLLSKILRQIFHPYHIVRITPNRVSGYEKRIYKPVLIKRVTEFPLLLNSSDDISPNKKKWTTEAQAKTQTEYQWVVVSRIYRQIICLPCWNWHSHSSYYSKVWIQSTDGSIKPLSYIPSLSLNQYRFYKNLGRFSRDYKRLQRPIRHHCSSKPNGGDGWRERSWNKSTIMTLKQIYIFREKPVLQRYKTKIMTGVLGTWR